jgi:hypothetical protein
MKEIHGSKHFGFIPKTYILPQEFIYLEDELRANPAKMCTNKQRETVRVLRVFRQPTDIQRI